MRGWAEPRCRSLSAPRRRTTLSLLPSRTLVRALRLSRGGRDWSDGQGRSSPSILPSVDETQAYHAHALTTGTDFPIVAAMFRADLSWAAQVVRSASVGHRSPIAWGAALETVAVTRRAAGVMTAKSRDHHPGPFPRAPVVIPSLF